MARDASGACWAVVRERFNQFMFGFYPPELYWRPILTFVLLLVALAPVLFDWMPMRRQMLIFAGAYPVIAYYLLWGGSIWPFVTFAVAAVIALAAFRAILRLDHPVLGTPGVAIAGAALGAFVYLRFLWGPITEGIHAVIGTLGPESVGSDQFGGFLLTLIIGVTAISASLPIGIAAGARPPVGADLHQDGLGGDDRVHPRRAADHAAVRGVDAAQLLPAAGDELRHHPARADHGDALLGRPI